MLGAPALFRVGGITVSDPNVIPWDDDEMHPLAIEGDCFDDFANLAAWSDTLAARFPEGVVYSNTGSIDNTTRPYNGENTYNLAVNEYLQLQKLFSVSYPAITLRSRAYIPSASTYDGNGILVGGFADSDSYNASGYIEYQCVADKWGREYSFGDGITPLPPIDAPAGVKDNWRVFILQAKISAPNAPIDWDFWYEGVHQWGPEQVLYAPDPMPTSGIQYLDMNISKATVGAGASLSMWDVTPGLATALYSGLTG